MPKEKFQAGQMLTTDLMDKFMQQSQVLQSTGNSESDLMSQNAVTAQLNLKANAEGTYTVNHKPLPTDIGALPASGGTMQGGILFSNGGQVFKGNLQVNGAWRAYAGKTDGSKGGCFKIATAGKGNEPVYVRQYLDDFKYVNSGVTLLDEDGKSNFQYLQENYKRVYSENYFPTEAYITAQFLSDNGWGYVKFASKVMILWDHGDAAPNTWVRFGVNFAHAPIVVTAETHQDGSHNNLTVTNVGTTGFTVRKGNGNDWCYYNYVAIGYW